MYLDLDVILAELKADDWLASDVNIESAEEPKTSVATGIELQYAIENEWERDRVVRAHREVAGANVELVPLTGDALDAAADLRARHEAVNYPALLAPFRLAAVGHSSRAGLFLQRNCAPRPPVVRESEALSSCRGNGGPS